MIESIQGVFEQVTLFDYVYIVLTILFIIQGTSKGFVLSILSAAKWILSYVITIYVFPKVKPYVEDIIDNEYVLDIILGIGIFIVIIFIILLINKALSKVISYSGIGTIDKSFWFENIPQKYAFSRIHVCQTSDIANKLLQRYH